MRLLPSGVKKTHIKPNNKGYIQKHPRYGRGVFCCGGCRRANSHNILFLVLFWYLFFGVMFVFVTFAVHKIHDWVIKRKSYDEKTTIWGKGGRILRT